MSGITGILYTGMQALTAHQRGIEVAGHNIANVNTPGYSRQTVHLKSNMPIMTSQGMVGTGVTAQQAKRVYDQFVELQIENEKEEVGRWDAQRNALENVEIIFNESSDSGLNKTMGEFWNAWQDLVNNPSGNLERQALLGKGEILAFEFQGIYNRLTPIQSDLNTSITGTVDEINFKTAEIANLNQKIMEIEGTGVNANDYRDARDLAVKDLALMIDLKTYEETSGSLSVSLGDGTTLVTGSTVFELTTMINDSGNKDLALASHPDDSISDKISGGKIKGWLEVRDVIIPEYKENMEDLVNGLKGVESTKVVTAAASTLNGGEYFTINSPATSYYVWYSKDGAGADPAPGGQGIKVEVSDSDTAAEVAIKTAAAIAKENDASGAVFDVAVTGGSTIAIANVAPGGVDDSADFNTKFAITKRVDGGNGINFLHRNGFDLNGQSGEDFFSGTLTGNSFALNEAVAADPGKIAAAGTAAGAPGDNSNAVAIADLQNAMMMNNNTSTFDLFYNAMVTDIGNEVRYANTSYEHHASMTTHLENYRESISGVSLDEEMISLVQFQLAYNAAAKLIKVTDEMLQTLINIV